MRDLAELRKEIDEIDGQMVKLFEQRMAVQEKEAILQDPPVPSGKIPTWRELFLRSDTASKRALIHQLIERIDVTREKMVIRFRIGLGGYLPKP